jgi:hypothetical protein
MRDNTEWKKVCEQASQEQDPEKLMELTNRIIQLLDQRLVDARRRKETGRGATDTVENLQAGD